MDAGNPIRHLAILADRVAGWGGDPDAEVAASLARAAEVVDAALGSLPGLAAVSFFSPDLRERLLDPARGAATATACARWLAGLEATAGSHCARLRLLGRRDRLPPGLTAPPGPARGRSVCCFLDYSAREEILRAAGDFLRAHPGEALREEEFGDLLDTAGIPDPDLIVSVGGEFEPHDFLLWQGSYAELWHTPRPWREFAAADLAAAVDDYRARQRRFGR